MQGAGCMSTIRYTRSVQLRALFGPSFLLDFLRKDSNGKKCLEVILNNRIFREKYALKFSFCPKSFLFFIF